MEEYKGIFYGDNTEKKYYEGGAHFQYGDLVKVLLSLKKQQQSQNASMSSLTTNDQKPISSTKKSFIVSKNQSIGRENYSNSVNKNQSKITRLNFNLNNNNHKIIQSYKEKLRYSHKSIYSRNVPSKLYQGKTTNYIDQNSFKFRDHNYNLSIINNHVRNNSKEQYFLFKSTSLRALGPIKMKKNSRNVKIGGVGNNISQKSFLFIGENNNKISNLRSRNRNKITNGVKKSNSVVKTIKTLKGELLSNNYQGNNFSMNRNFNKTLLSIKMKNNIYH